MLKTIINTILSSLALATAFGVILHDTQLDRATAVAIAVPVAALGYAAADASIKAGDAHVHVERVSLAKISGLRTTLPRLNPREDDRHARKQNKIAFLGAGSAETVWPSI